MVGTLDASGASFAGGTVEYDYWLLSRRGRTHETFLTVGLDEKRHCRVLPVFTAEYLAGEYLAGEFLGGRDLDAEVWHVRGVESGELISVLYGPCGGVEEVALDPVASQPAPVVKREEFLDVLSGRSCS